MANEIQVEAVTGLTVVVQIYNGATPVGSPIATAEIGATGNYVASIPGGTPYGYYLLVASVVGGDNPTIASGDIFWDGDFEIIKGLATVQGMDPNNPASTTPSLLSAGPIQIAITGDQITDTTLTRTG